VARACEAAQGTPFVLSSNSNVLIEDVSSAAPSCPKFFQVYMSTDMEVNKDIWRRAIESGFTGFALTCDTQLLGKRRNDVRNKFQLPSHLSIENYTRYQSKG